MLDKLSTLSNFLQYCNVCFDFFSISILQNLSYLIGLVRDIWSHQMSLSPRWFTHRVITDKVHRSSCSSRYLIFGRIDSSNFLVKYQS